MRAAPVSCGWVKGHSLVTAPHQVRPPNASSLLGATTRGREPRRVLQRLSELRLARFGRGETREIRVFQVGACCGREGVSGSVGGRRHGRREGRTRPQGREVILDPSTQPSVLQGRARRAKVCVWACAGVQRACQTTRGLVVVYSVFSQSRATPGSQVM